MAKILKSHDSDSVRRFFHSYEEACRRRWLKKGERLGALLAAEPMYAARFPNGPVAFTAERLPPEYVEFAQRAGSALLEMPCSISASAEAGAWRKGRWYFASFGDGAGYWFFRLNHKGVYGSDELGNDEGLVATSFSVVLGVWAFLIDEGGYVSVDGLGERALKLLAKSDPAGFRTGVGFWRRALGFGAKPGAKRG